MGTLASLSLIDSPFIQLRFNGKIYKYKSTNIKMVSLATGRSIEESRDNNNKINNNNKSIYIAPILSSASHTR